MEHPHLEALTIAAERRGVVSREQAARLHEHLLKQGVTQPVALREWLGSAPGLSHELARQLMACLAVERFGGPDAFGQWRPVAVLNEGTASSSLLALDQAGELVLIKTLGEAAGRGHEFQMRFAREVAIMQELHHPNMVRFLDTGVGHGERPYLVLEYVPCATLSQLVARGRLEPRLALTVVSKILDVVGLMDGHGLVHRDIKPANIYASTEGLAKLGDFGTARSTADDRMELTALGSVIGSPQYMSPEQGMGVSDVDVRSDIYSCGGVLFFALAGQDPYTGKLHDILKARHEGVIPSIRALRSDVPEAIDRILASAMAKDPADRYQVAAAMSADIDAILDPLGGPLGDDGLGEESVVLSPGDSERIEKELSGMLEAPFKRPQRSDREPPTEGVAAPTLRNKPVATDADEQAADAFSGSIDEATTADWLCLQQADGPGQIMLYARSRLICGKMREHPVNLCLRNYPLEQHKTDCAKVSRKHVALGYDKGNDSAVVVDLGSANGTVLGGQQMMVNQAVTLSPGIDYRMILAGVVALTLHAVPRRADPVVSLSGCALDATGAATGLGALLSLDALTIRRPDNAPERSVGLVLRRLLIGGSGAELPVFDAIGQEQVEVARFAGHWIWRDQGPWQPLAIGQELQAGGHRYRVLAGDYEQFS